MAWMVIAAWRSILSEKGIITVRQPFINTWIQSWSSIRLYVRKSRNTSMEKHIRYLKISFGRILLQKASIKSSVLISPIFSSQIMKYAITAPSSIYMIEVLLPASQTVTSPVILQSGHCKRRWISSQRSKGNWYFTVIRDRSSRRKHLSIFVNLFMWHKAWVKQVIHMTTHQWKDTLIH